MGRDEIVRVVEDVEEGEISDTASVEEISEADFKKQDGVKERDGDKELKQQQQQQQQQQQDSSKSRVWTMSDLYKYQMGGGFVNGLYNLAWAQAVQNKPFNDLFVDVEPEENSKRSSPSSSVASVNSGERKVVVDRVIIDDSGDEMDVMVVDVEKEEDELEEGEIDLDSEQQAPAAATVELVTAAVKQEPGGEQRVVDSDDRSAEDGLEKKVKFISEALESVTVVEAGKSFASVCSKLQSTLESLREVVQKNNLPRRNALFDSSLTAVKAVNSVYCSMNHQLKEQNKAMFSRLLSLINIHDPPLFHPEQIKEIEDMVSSVHSSGFLSTMGVSDEEKDTSLFDLAKKKDNDPMTETADNSNVNRFPSAAESLLPNKTNMSPEVSKTGISSFKNRGGLLPLLDLHKDHDVDSLPSPTREIAPSLPVPSVINVGDGITKPGLPGTKVTPSAEDSRICLYETDALKAVSSYQQKFGRSSFLMNDRLPSPTPSEESGGGDGDTGGEVCSSSVVSDSRTINTPVLTQSIASPSHSPQRLSQPGVVHGRNAAPVSSGSNTTTKASAKSRDPRLRHVNSDASDLNQNRNSFPIVSNAPKVEAVGGFINSRKQKAVEDPILVGSSLKRQRSALDDSGIVRDVKSASGSGGWLEDTDMVGHQAASRNRLTEYIGSPIRRMDNGVVFPDSASTRVSVTSSDNEQIPVTGTHSVTGGEQVPVTGTSMNLLPDLLKDIAVNPTMLMNLLKMGQQQKLGLENQQILADPTKSTPTSNLMSGTVPPVNVAPQASGALPRLAGMVQVPSQTYTTDELAKVRMKPRDPRRVLHNNTLQKTGSMGSEQFKANVPASITQGTKDNLNVRSQDSQAESKALPSQTFVPSDISLQFTKSLKNIADIVSVSQASPTPPIVSPDPVSQSMPIKSDTMDVIASSSSSDLHSQTALAADGGMAGPRPQNTWGDVEHLFEGYDDQQRAAIQRERARRIEEQKKMFAAHKLCLVLDLDHTLLNSAKFVEVDPVHDEILRKKEEQDRERPQRHLFRFSHMGMWTKLRPGIWNFLEKASKLFELHLYTMGNKLYATEMAKVLDPKGVLFNGRVISRGDDGDPFDGDERVPKSKDLEGVLGMESAVVIIDDSVRVWPHNKLNLIVVERYIYFPCSRRQFGLPGPSLLEIDHDERPEDGTLACSLAVIERIHQNFFAHQSLEEADVRNILASEQRKILAGCRILFSRVFPVGEANPHLHPLWQTAEQFGAVCTNQIDEQVTHVVAHCLGTDKVNWAQSTGRFVVNPGWVEASALLYRRANEQDFAIKPI